jgi:hypothetical protein
LETTLTEDNIRLECLKLANSMAQPTYQPSYQQGLGGQVMPFNPRKPTADEVLELADKLFRFVIDGVLGETEAAAELKALREKVRDLVA